MVIKTFHVVFQVPNISSCAACSGSLVSLIFDGGCGRGHFESDLDEILVPALQVRLESIGIDRHMTGI